MYFTRIRLTGLTAISMQIVDALPSHAYILKEATGLGPPEVDVFIASTLNAGGVYQGRRPQNRELVFLIGLNPNYSVGQKVTDLREIFYGMLTPGHKDYVTVEILDVDTVLAYTTGYVKKLEIVPFDREPKLQLTIGCTEQYFQTPTDLYLEPPDKADPQIMNEGTAPAGFRMEVIFTGSVSYWELSEHAGQKMKITYPFLSGDKLIIDTRPGKRGIWVVRGATTNIIFALSVDSIWFMLHGGMNSFTTSSQGFNWGTIFYRPQYWGI